MKKGYMPFLSRPRSTGSDETCYMFSQPVSQTIYYRTPSQQESQWNYSRPQLDRILLTSEADSQEKSTHLTLNLNVNTFRTPSPSWLSMENLLNFTLNLKGKSPPPYPESNWKKPPTPHTEADSQDPPPPHFTLNLK